MHTQANSKSDNDVIILSDIYLKNLFSPFVAGLLHMQVDYLQYTVTISCRLVHMILGSWCGGEKTLSCLSRYESLNRQLV